MCATLRAQCADFLVLDVSMDQELSLLLGGPFLSTCRALIDMGRGTLTIDDGGCFEVGRDEDDNLKYGPITPSFLDIEDDIERALAMESYFIILGLYTQSDIEHRLFWICFSQLKRNGKTFEHTEYWNRIGDLNDGRNKLSQFYDPFMQVLRKLIIEAFVHRAPGMKEASDIYRGHYVIKIAKMLEYHTNVELGKCLEAVISETWDAKMFGAWHDFEPLPEPERTLNQRLHRQNRRVPFKQRNEPPTQSKVVYASIHDINYFHHFFDILKNYNPMDEESMWAADHVVAPTPSFAITIPETANEFAIKARMDVMTMKMDAQYKDFQSRSKQPNIDHNDDNKPMSPEEEAKFMQTFRPKNMIVEVGKFNFPMDFLILKMEEDSKVPLILGRPFLHTVDAVIRVKHKQLNLGVGTERMIFHIHFSMKHSYSNDATCYSIDDIDKILEEDFDSLLDEGSKILHSIERTIFKEKLFVEFNEFMAMNIDENSKSETDPEELPLKKIIFNTNYKIKTSLE
nr:reverse transcriptase domain-containing protein [Tanacetum cinerariifolium]GEW81412.1 reverse transcriptase domain-containing protein [Tanacetum cinerariifolium]